jgi:protein phosphatase
MGWLPAAFGDVYVISDGMGGYRGGALAAQLTVDTLKQSLAQGSTSGRHLSAAVRQAFIAANEAVYQRRDPSDPDTRDMGATAVMLITRGSRFMVAHVGDSRAYLWRARSGLQRLTKDHTQAQTMVEQGLISASEVATHPDASVLSRAIGHTATVDVDIADWRRINAGDMLLLCSDGLSGYLSDSEIASVLRSEEAPREIADSLIDAALAKGGEDNVTVQLLRYSPANRSRGLLGVVGGFGIGLAAASLTGWTLLNSDARQSLEDLTTLRGQVTAMQDHLDRQAAEIAIAGKDIESLRGQLAQIELTSKPPQTTPPAAPAPNFSTTKHAKVPGKSIATQQNASKAKIPRAPTPANSPPVPEAADPSPAPAASDATAPNTHGTPVEPHE